MYKSMRQVVLVISVLVSGSTGIAMDNVQQQRQRPRQIRCQDMVAPVAWMVCMGLFGEFSLRFTGWVPDNNPVCVTCLWYDASTLGKESKQSSVGTLSDQSSHVFLQQQENNVDQEADMPTNKVTQKSTKPWQDNVMTPREQRLARIRGKKK